MAIDILNLVLWTVSVISAPFVLGYVYFKLRARWYWKRRNIEYLEPTFLVGNTAALNISKSFGEVIDGIYEQTKDKPMVGMWMYTAPSLVANDIGLIKNILVKDFQHFHDRGGVYDPEVDPLADHLFNMAGTKWRNLRVKLTPTFTSGKMKFMFPTIAECGKELQEFFSESALKNEVIEVKDIMARFTTDVISSCAFGIQTNSLKDPNAEFRVHGKRAFKPTYYEIFMVFLAFLYPPIIKFVTVRQVPKEPAEFFMRVVKETIATREKNNIKRNDFMDLLIQILKKGKVDDADHVEGEDKGDPFTVNVLAAQAFVFFGAGFETSSTTMTFALYELGLNPDLREKCQAEIDRVLEKHGNQITYESIQEMSYLECVVQETLRKYPVVPTLTRECNKDYNVPGTDIVIEKGMAVLIPVSAVQSDPNYFPDPKRFDPDRFTPEEKAKRDHFTHLPFGEGPRICIGNRFGLLQTKVGLVSVLSKYNLEICKDTEIPIKMDPKAFTLSPLNGVYMKISKRNL